MTEKGGSKRRNDRITVEADMVDDVRAVVTVTATAVIVRVTTRGTEERRRVAERGPKLIQML